ncbi:uncharacterized protein K444DRAFT_610955 [Hyaloscypha bicolor E]|uniref:REJ domain-containing protein n=1 Tax=Hyaloscypha bicolor E TaxID=1095630 RepID=A0A2J6TIT3_9HELO|nr:uncharacterized protein K444DRAFT_610955 [Hyaloscypha bicolor E]PMD62927.1 hypothetical protein K444DRAFT_610955 [Hyaloscypha bicolor E]
MPLTTPISTHPTLQYLSLVLLSALIFPSSQPSPSSAPSSPPGSLPQNISTTPGLGAPSHPPPSGRAQS